ncbi:5-(carboxyamino)imidazole ribonucleotide synthase [Aurantiacibacter poecillastricola]|uniref:5-(carboxyamino)imidazole ribonucleotide synthase n=1 Tax=Aurantiacibacter poecillastricola TaxID=3064385 RepID=UPI002740251C|nr:5-(carboxyamino)imidazole ribonucleotide synthase [Aurantiacibacter sp. 219JJ12-13]MDP5260426.1 5-(carboxyamino)imidazole ribonucleotide synthase [Aurantiacibacter sp. 219JJ12-13]
MSALPPGSTIGILGGGQLGRMMAMSAAQLGYRCHVYAPEGDNVAADVSARFTSARWHDTEALIAFAHDCDVITYEFENVPVAPLLKLPQELLAPGPRALEVAQDRVKEKRFVEDAGGRPAPYVAVDHDNELAGAVERIGVPGILKTRRDGYDGKGQWAIDSGADAQGIRIPETGCVYEAKLAFECEFSVILVRGRDGEVRFWDSTRNRHDKGILAHCELPAPAIVGEQLEQARGLAAKVAEALGYIGVLTLEFFATKDGPVFNEMAPRVHNSGHWTIEGAVTSQFENHVRAICGLPLGDTRSVSDTMVMDNLIGRQALDLATHLADGRAHVHLYGKSEARAGRKMGHVTWVG